MTIRLLHAPAPPSPNISEAAFQDLIIDLATTFGWAHYHTYDSRRSDPGFPDLVLVKPPHIIIAELKARRGVLSMEQALWGAMLRECGILSPVWRPSDWDEIVRTLTED